MVNDKISSLGPYLKIIRICYHAKMLKNITLETEKI